jgi:hypothetical protein
VNRWATEGNRIQKRACISAARDAIPSIISARPVEGEGPSVNAQVPAGSSTNNTVVALEAGVAAAVSAAGQSILMY